ncbi:MULTISPECIES: ABC transporter ATP-binding protein [unclassified Roseovarius]|uniref:ABC transporter ATP-binding protein n=1 Tax=unclassified Roseovarius TaxID=2614913 RepID=UPI00273FE825|nr:sn-glycerol-3-phosphate ABC transporter ATP-binding protein UgpC [Roseovarius sp. MMSF_3350]
MANLNLSRLGKTYPGNVIAVSDVSAEIEHGEFIVLVGPSGCGKSTILRMIAGLETITTGDLHIGKRHVNGLEPGDRDIAMVFQNYALYPHMTVRKNMEYGLRNEGLPRAEIDTRIAEATRTLRLEDYLDRKPRQLSGGQRQRVAMGRAIVRDPAVFLFDEPLSNLDAKLRTQLRAELKSLHQRLGATFIYVTHDQVEAMSLAHRIIIMSQGRVEQIGTPMDLYHRPATRFVADFIGTPAMNMLNATLSRDQASATLADGTAIPLPAPISRPPGAALTLGLRPEHLVVGHAGPITLALRSVFTEHLGADTLLHACLADSDTPVIMRLNAADAPAAGHMLTASASPDKMHLFDAVTGARIAT